MAKIVIEQADGTPRVVKDKPFDLERVLQDNIKRLPDLIPIEEATGEPVRLLPIGIEVGVPTGAMDLLLLDSAGVLTIVETKLAKNPESRREVIGQVLEYAAYISEWGLEEIERHAEQFLGSDEADGDYKDLAFEDALAKFLGLTEGDTEALGNYLDRLSQNLKAGKLRLIVATDRLVETARKTITFVNTYSSFEIYLLQITCYEDDDRTRVYVPSLHGYARKVPVTPQRTHEEWTWEKYEAELGWSEEQVRRAQDLLGRLEAVSKGWQPQARLNPSWITVYCLGKAVFGVQLFKKRGLELWFRSEHRPDEPLPPAVALRQTKGYLYLGGNLESLQEHQLRALCEVSLRQVGLEP
jgi:hypothetical protein